MERAYQPSLCTQDPSLILKPTCQVLWNSENIKIKLTSVPHSVLHILILMKTQKSLSAFRTVLSSGRG